MSKLEKCPVCDGRGFVKGNFYDVAGETCSFGDYIKKGNEAMLCKRCCGNGIVCDEQEEKQISKKLIDEKTYNLIKTLFIIVLNDKENSINVINNLLNDEHYPENIKESLKTLKRECEENK